MVRSYSMEGRNAAVEANRRLAIDAALDILATSGVEGLTMQVVADQAGVSLRSLYNYFATREKLLAEVFDALVQVSQQAIELTVPADSDARSRLTRFAETHFDVLRTQRRHMAVLLGLRGVPELEERVRTIRAWRHRTLRGLYRDCGLRGSELDRAAAAAYALTTFATYTALTDELGLTHRAAVRTIVEPMIRLAG